MNDVFNDTFMLDEREIQEVKHKKGIHNQLTFGVMLKFFEVHKRFPESEDITEGIYQAIAYQLDCNCLQSIDFSGRSSERFRNEIRASFGFRLAIQDDKNRLVNHIKTLIFPNGASPEQAIEHAYDYFRDHKVDPFSSKQLDGILRTAHNEFEEDLFKP